MISNKIQYRNFGLDIMRAIAITLVLGIHLTTNIFTNEIGIFWYLAYLGVDMFFVLSGFLIGNILLSCIGTYGKISWSTLRRFYIRRWLRTVPLYYILLLTNFIIGYFFFGNINHLDLRYFFWLQNFNHPPPSFFGESWSLSIEEWFYFIFPLGMFLVLKFNSFTKNYTYKLLIYNLLFIVMINLFRILNENFGRLEFNIVVFRLDSIGYGVLFSILERYFFKEFFKSKRKICGAIGLVLLVLGVFFFLKIRYFGSWYLLYYPLSGMGLSFCLLYLKGLKPFAPQSINGIIEWLSKVSYSVYLNNLIIIYLITNYLRINPLLQFFIALSLILFLSNLTYNLVERKALQMREHYFPTIK